MRYTVIITQCGKLHGKFALSPSLNVKLQFLKQEGWTRQNHSVQSRNLGKMATMATRRMVGIQTSPRIQQLWHNLSTNSNDFHPAHERRRGEHRGRGRGAPRGPRQDQQVQPPTPARTGHKRGVTSEECTSFYPLCRSSIEYADPDPHL